MSFQTAGVNSPKSRYFRTLLMNLSMSPAAWEMRPQSRLYQCFFSPCCVTKGMKKSGQETHGFLLAFFCALYGSCPISVCRLILFYEQLPNGGSFAVLR
jgi:hypothetical protein